MISSSSNHSKHSLAEAFQSLCGGDGCAPDVFEFLSQHPAASAEEIAAVCSIDQSRRWQAGSGLPVESYLGKYPVLNTHIRAKLRLILGEFQHLSGRGERLDIAVFASRFPDVRNELHEQLSARRKEPADRGVQTTAVQGPDTDKGAIFDEPFFSVDEAVLHSPATSNRAVDQPQFIGRFRVQRILGDGGFGRVYLAFDEELRRSVAIKVPHAYRIANPSDIETYFEEARILASLDHPAIVPVFDFGRTDDGRCFIVSKYIEGSDLATKNKHVHFSFSAVAELLSVVAEALHYSHLHGVVHRDIKPANILIDTENRPYLADFGIALKDENWGKDRPSAGTPAYMSPEQVRGEGHLVDGRSDVFSLGIVLYELLSNRRPFGKAWQERQSPVEARPLRQIDDSIPQELERICLKSLSYRVSERYSTARDMAEDLRYFLSQGIDLSARAASGARLSNSGAAVSSELQSAATNPLTIIPKGLRSFDGDDAGFFLELLPGPRDRDGLPESVRFWRTRILEEDPEKTFRVGLVYGPSGCGKSSFLKAAVIPHLPENIVRIYVESTPHDTELRLLKALRKSCPTLSRELDLAGTLAAIRRGLDLPVRTKVLIVLDQFEQWLHSRQDHSSSELVRALRQCDGAHLQCVISARDDFWMAITHFMEDLDVSLIPNNNISAIDLFGMRHARKVLTAMGRAYGALPPGHEKLDQLQTMFIEQATNDLAQNQQVIPVHLALFAEMVKDKRWTPSTLQELGGAKGVGVTFLEETFNGRTANPQHRIHQKAARSVLSMLLSDQGGGIKGGMRSYQELLAGSGYDDHKRDFDVLLRILDSELRLITPTDPVGQSTGNDVSDRPQLAEERYYNLTHDYLVPSLTEWLTQKKKATRRGRAELLLEERAQSWQARPSSRTLPSLLEWLSILAFTTRKNRAHQQAEQKMMRRASRYYLSRMAMAVVLALCVGWWISDSVPRARSHSLVESLRTAPTEDVPAIIEPLEPIRRWANPLLLDALFQAGPDSRARVNFSLALLPSNPNLGEYLRDRMLLEPPASVAVISRALIVHTDQSQLASHLWAILTDPAQESNKRFRAAAALAGFETSSPEAQTKWKASADFVAEQLISQIADNQSQFNAWIALFQPARDFLIDHLSKVYASTDRGELDREFAASILGEYVSDRPQPLVELLLTATPPQHRKLFSKLEAHRPEAKNKLLFIYNTLPTPEEKYDARSRVLERRAHAAALLFALGDADPTWQSLGQTDDPEITAFLEKRLTDLVLNCEAISSKLSTTTTASLRGSLLRVLAGIDATARQNFRPDLQENCLTAFETAFRTEPDSGVHSAAEWGLRSWGRSDKIESLTQELASKEIPPDRTWLISPTGHSMAIFRGPVEAHIGSLLDEPNRDASDESPLTRKINRTFSVGTKEVSFEQYLKFDPGFPHRVNGYTPSFDCPAAAVTWHRVAEYCNWLSKEEGITEDQWCYEEVRMYVMKPVNDYLSRTGYRLPSEAEWEYACRAGSVDSYSWGNARSLASRFTWNIDNSKGHNWPVGSLCPNRFGLFDMHGSVAEWTQDPCEEDSPPVAGDDVEMIPEPYEHDLKRAERGGSASESVAYQRAANRRQAKSFSTTSFLRGFRIARSLK
ncbi:MAG: serine/threonine protein kinase [Planctomycetota bacterium]|nr:MAG: serine/threonine protein kinase [Planctomycetota bacterium]